MSSYKRTELSTKSSKASESSTTRSTSPIVEPPPTSISKEELNSTKGTSSEPSTGSPKSVDPGKVYTAPELTTTQVSTNLESTMISSNKWEQPSTTSTCQHLDFYMLLTQVRAHFYFKY